MELFSKRNLSHSSIRRLSFGYGYYNSKNRDKEGMFLSDFLRKRLQVFIEHIASSHAYLEKFLLVDNKDSKKVYFCKNALKDFSSRELGYDFDEFFNCKSFDFYDNSDNGSYSDIKLFDLIEFLIIFSKNNKRKDLKKELMNIFNEEGGYFKLHGFMIFQKELTGLESIMSLIKERNLKNKLKDFYSARRISSGSLETASRISADILQIIFSDPSKRSHNKNYAERICNLVAEKWAEKNNQAQLGSLLSDLVKQSKKLNNEIENIRHTDRTTIAIDNPGFYKLITYKNISIIELVILSLPELYISEENPEMIKNSYLKQYELNKDNGWVVKPKEKLNDEINHDDDLPF